MTPDQITALANTGESETLEFKSTTGTRREAVRTVCAMAAGALRLRSNPTGAATTPSRLIPRDSGPLCQHD